MTELTKEQIEEFWKGYGFKVAWSDAYGSTGWNAPDGHYCFDLPDTIDLNNLFKYAVPKAVDKIMAKQMCSSDLAYAILFKKWLQKLELDIPNHAGSLFWVLWEVEESNGVTG